MAEFYVAAARVELAIWDSNSLKDKRAVLRSIVDRAQARFNISIAEVGARNSWRRTVLAIASINTQPAFARQSLERVISYVESHFGCEVISVELEVFEQVP